MPTVLLRYVALGSRGVYVRGADVADGVWIRLSTLASELDSSIRFNGDTFEVGWRQALHLLLAASPLQSALGFSFDTDSSSDALVQRFIVEVRTVRSASASLRLDVSAEETQTRLEKLGWRSDRHRLHSYQVDNLRALLALGNGANFSVPGAGKTTVTFALHLLLPGEVDHLLVVAPPNAFMAWEEVIDECLLPTAPAAARQPFVQLVDGEANILSTLKSQPKRLLISYDQMVRVEHVIEHLLTTRRVHLVLDEAHRIKAGTARRRGTVLLRVGYHAARRDILTGTPMPQRALDLQPQLNFLWPGVELGSRIAAGEAPRQVLGNLYVRTTKQQLGLEPRTRITVPVELTDAHKAFYAVLRNDLHAKASKLRRGASGVELVRTRRSVLRLLKAAVNPMLLAQDIELCAVPEHAGLLRAVIAEGPSARVRLAVDRALALIEAGRKVLLWTSFTSTLLQLQDLLSDAQPAVVYGETTVGDEDDVDSRQGQIHRFKTDPQCMALIANPAAASEGMSLHMQCHDAIYVDRSYNATHFLQSIDRIHRLGLPAGTQTTIYVLENTLSPSVGSIDVSVARRLGAKIRAMEQLLQDSDLHELALDEESMTGSLEDSIDRQDIEDIIAELEGRAAPIIEGDTI